MMVSLSKAVSTVNTHREERHAMDMKQILIFVLFLVPVWTCKKRCYDEDKLSEAAERKLRTLYRQPTERSSAAVADSQADCPLALYQQLAPKSLEDRSLSPWRYVHVPKEGYFPSTYVEAQCLCSGCILIQDKSSSVVVESNDYNSVPIKQTRMFLKRELCEDDQQVGQKKYRLMPVYEEVVVGCTCARVRTSL